jgi:hypothetical protein
LQKKAPNALKSLDAKLKSAPALGTFFAPPAQRAGRGGDGHDKKDRGGNFPPRNVLKTNNRAKKSMLR